MVLLCYFKVNREDTINFSRVSITSFARIIRYFLMYLLTFCSSYEPTVDGLTRYLEGVCIT